MVPHSQHEKGQRHPLDSLRSVRLRNDATRMGKEVDGYVREVENILGRRLEAGYNEEAKSLRLTFDPVVTLHKPILWYLVSTSR